MIRGQHIETLAVIRDTTAGRISVWMIVIMLFFLYMLYLLVLYRLERLQIDRLVRLRQSFEQELAAVHRNANTMPDRSAPRIKAAKQNKARQTSDAEDKEALELFTDLKKHNHRRW